MSNPFQEYARVWLQRRQWQYILIGIICDDEELKCIYSNPTIRYVVSPIWKYPRDKEMNRLQNSRNSIQNEGQRFQCSTVTWKIVKALYNALRTDKWRPVDDVQQKRPELDVHCTVVVEQLESSQETHWNVERDVV